jgi:hypothetical protein
MISCRAVIASAIVLSLAAVSQASHDLQVCSQQEVELTPAPAEPAEDVFAKLDQVLADAAIRAGTARQQAIIVRRVRSYRVWRVDLPGVSCAEAPRLAMEMLGDSVVTVEIGVRDEPPAFTSADFFPAIRTSGGFTAFDLYPEAARRFEAWTGAHVGATAVVRIGDDTHRIEIPIQTAINSGRMLVPSDRLPTGIAHAVVSPYALRPLSCGPCEPAAP